MTFTPIAGSWQRAAGRTIAGSWQLAAGRTTARGWQRAAAVIIAPLALWLVAAPAAAQPPSPSRPALSVQVGGGLVTPIGDATAASGPGWNVSVAGGLDLHGGISLRAQYLYSRFAAEETRVSLGRDGAQPGGHAVVRGKPQSHAGFLDLLVKRPGAGSRAAAYLLAGPVVALRRVTLTGSGDGSVNQCLPQWLQCSASPVSFDRAIGIRRGTSFGASVGAGVTFDVGLTARVFVEARYIYLDGPSFTASDGTTHRASASYVPVTAGLRF